MARLWTRILGVVVVGAVGCYSDDGADTGGGCADCVFESGDYEYSAWTLVSDGCGFDLTDPDGAWVYVDVNGEDFAIEDFIEGTLSNGIATGGHVESFDLAGNGYDCVLDYTADFRGRVTEDGVLEVTSHTFGYEDAGGTQCDLAWTEFGFTDLPCGGEQVYTLTYQ